MRWAAEQEQLLELQEEIDSYGFWRLQEPGFPLSVHHKSYTWGIDEDEEGYEEHAGSSAVSTLRDVGRAQANIDTDEVELIGFYGREVATGVDGEPIVIPEQEAIRLRTSTGGPNRFDHLKGWGYGSRVNIIEILRAGWHIVPTLPVVGVIRENARDRRRQKEPLDFDEVHTRGVLAGAYAGRERTRLTHMVYRREGVDVRVGCRQPLYNMADEYAGTEKELRSRPTCPTCARKWDRLQQK